jgi:hypothetical protein
VATTLNNLGNVLSDLGERAAARAAYEEALRISDALEAPTPHEAGGTRCNLAHLLWEDGQRQQAFKQALEAVSALERWLSEVADPTTWYSFTDAIRTGYHIHLADPWVARDPERVMRVVESLRQGELLSGGMASPTEGSALSLAANDSVYLAVQRTIEGTLFVMRDLSGVHCYGANEEWNEAARSMLFVLRSDLGRFAPAELIADRGQELWAALPPEVQALLDDDRPVYLSPDDLTVSLPFEFLNPTGKLEDWLGLRHVLSRTPGLASYGRALTELTLQTDAAPNVTLFANPTHEGAVNLPGSEKEAGSVQGKLRLQSRLGVKVTPYLRAEATTERFLAELDTDPWIIHFTGHGGFGGDEPYLCFAGNGMLPARGLPNRRLNGHPLVILNCCLAGLATPMGGWYRGLVDGFLSRGAAMVVASSFPVSDFPSMHFSAAFYDRLLQPATTVGDAILHARQTVAAMPGSHPLWWGLFAPWGNVNARLGLS